MAIRVLRLFAFLAAASALLLLAGCGNSSVKACNLAGAAAACPCLSNGTLCVAPRYVYADGLDGKITVFPLDGHGALGTPISVSGPAMSLGMAQIGNQFLYASDAQSTTGTIDEWSINLSDGTLTALPPYSIGNLSIAEGLAADSQRSVLYVADAGRIDALKADLTGSLSPIANSPFPAGSALFITIDPSDRFLFSSEFAPPGAIGAFSIDPSTSELSEVSGSPFPIVPNDTTNRQPGALAVEASGKFLYVCLVATGEVAGFSIDATTGALTPIPGSPFAAGSTPISIVTAGKFVYVSAASGLIGYSLDPTTGILTQLSLPSIHAGALTTDLFGQNLYVSGSDGMKAYQIDTSTGALTQLGTTVPYAGATVLTYVL